MRGAVHRPVLLEEALAALNIQADGIYVDGTFGRGGHSRGILQRLGPQGRLLALDRDPAAVAVARAWNDARLSAFHSRFGRLAEILEAAGFRQVEGVLLDLGVSSPQLEEGERGFSFRLDGPLDMRMDPTSGESAREWLAHASEIRIGEVLKTYGEERFAKQIARAIVKARTTGGLGTTQELAAVVAAAVPTREPGQDPATRTFQALRIFVNQELEELSLALPQCVDALAPGGRLVIIAFHSLEDRIVKRFMRNMERGTAVPDKLPLRSWEMPKPRLRRLGRAVRPSPAEVADNPRSRSAVMRVAERLA